MLLNPVQFNAESEQQTADTQLVIGPLCIQLINNIHDKGINLRKFLPWKNMPHILIRRK